MKTLVRILRALGIFLLLFSFYPAAPAQAAFPTFTPINGGSVTDQTLVDTLLGLDSGVVVTNVIYTGDNAQSGIFTTGDTLGFTGGVVLTNGRVDQIAQASSQQADNDMSQPGDADLDALTGRITADAAILQFDFTPTGNQVSFRFRLASEEYPSDFFGGFIDAFALFINGVNYAKLPNGQPVTIENVNPTTNVEYYVDNAGGGIEVVYDGFTILLNLSAPVIPDATNTIKMVIADGGDSYYDSAVFLEAGSFSGLPNQAPTDILLSDSLLAAGLPANTTVGTLTTLDPDEGQSFTYDLVTGAGDTNNASFVIAGDALKTAAILAVGDYQLRVRSTDDGTGFLTVEKPFTVTVYDTCETYNIGGFWFWSNPATWTNCGGGVPDATKSARIISGSSVYMDTEEAVLNLTIDSSGWLNLIGSVGLNIGGDLFNDWGLDPGGASTVTFDRAGSHTLTSNGTTTFYNLTIGATATVIVEDVGDNTTVLNALTNNGTLQKTDPINFAGVYNNFGPVGASLDVSDKGALTSLQVQRVGSPDPNENFNGGGSRMLDLHYVLEPNEEANSTFTTGLCLAYTQAEYDAAGLSNESDLRLCRWTGEAWECPARAAASSTANNTVCADGVSSFSNWTLGGVGPTAVNLSAFQAHASSSLGLTLPLAGVLALCCLGLVAVKRWKH